MGRIIRRTVTITITETVTITWATGDDPLGHPSTVVPKQPKTQGEAEETILPRRNDWRRHGCAAG